MNYNMHTEEHRDAVLIAITKCKLPRKVSITPITDDRTDPQNAYLFGVCYPPICEASGYIVADIHEWVCGQFFGWVDKKVPKTPNNPNGLESVPRRTTTRDENGKRDVMEKKDFSLMLESVVFPLASKLDVIILEAYK